MKKRHLKYFAGVVVAILFLGRLAAQNVSFHANAPRVVRSGEQFQLVYTLNQQGNNLALPDLGTFQLLGGPMTGYSSSTQFVNGKMSSSTSYTYTYYLQAPSSAGKYSLKPATIKVNNDVYKSNSLDIEVVGGNGGSQSSTASSGNSQGNTQSSAGSKAPTSVSAGDDVYVRLEVDKHTAYVGQQITAWVKIYTKHTISGIDQSYKGPDFVGFYQQPVDLPQNISLQREKVGNDIYYTGVFQKFILYPQRSGKITVNPFDMVVEIRKQSNRRPQSIFDQMFGPQYVQSRLDLKSKPVTFNIKPLPGNQPSDFNGAVGTFNINASANQTNVKTNDAITFKVVVSGKGNIKLLDNLNTQFPQSFESFEPQITTKLDKNNGGLSGYKTFEYTAVPRYAGDFKVAPFSLVYFDPANGKYNTISTQGFNIHVAKGQGDSTQVVAGNLSKQDIRLLGSDIRYIHTTTNLRRLNSFIFGSMGFYTVYILLVLILIIILIIRKEQIKRSANALKYRNRKAGKVASKRLKTASKLMKQGKKEEFYEELSNAMWGYLADKLSMPTSELSKDRVLAELSARNIDPELTDQFFKLTELSEFARFAPGGRESETGNLYEQAEKIINKMDQKI